MPKRKEFAPGIPDKERFEPIPTVPKTETWDSVIHKHDAFRAGRHFDLRLLEPKSDNLHSWALRRMPKPGEKVLAVHQPTHTADYIDFKGTIPKGYGAGPVNVHKRTKVKVHKASPSRITFQMGPGLYTLVHTKGKGKKDERHWLLINRTKTAQSASGVGAGPNDILALAFAKKLKGTDLQRIVEEMRNGRKRSPAGH
jgi:hypothetical protein